MPEKKKFNPEVLDMKCDGWNDLACAIVSQAVTDLREAIEKDLTCTYDYDKIRKMIYTIEAFFSSDLCGAVWTGDPHTILFGMMNEAFAKHSADWVSLRNKIFQRTIQDYWYAINDQLTHPTNNKPRVTIILLERYMSTEWFHFLSKRTLSDVLNEVFLKMIERTPDLQNEAGECVLKTKQCLHRLAINHKDNPDTVHLIDKIEAMQDFMHTEWFRWLETI